MLFREICILPEHEQHFKAEDVELSIGKSKENKPLLAIGGVYYTEWFREQKSKSLEKVGIKVNEGKRGDKVN